MLQPYGGQCKVRNPHYGQLVVGPPGSGKTTYCVEALKFYKELGRDVGIVNFDPANEETDYTPIIDIKELITIEACMEKLDLGPNGALMYCAEYLETHFDDWLLPELRKAETTCRYIIFDCPGQIELYTHHTAMAAIFERLQRVGYQLVVVNLVDSHYCSEPPKFVSTLLMALSMMLRLALPHVNVFSKADELHKYESKLLFNLEYYTEVLDLQKLLDALEDTPSMRKYSKLSAAICSLVEDYALVSFKLLNVFDKQSLLRLRNAIDKANGYVYKAGEEQSVNSLMACAVGAEPETMRNQQDIDPFAGERCMSTD